jgi:uncharacterized protein (TIGR03382 family)
MRRSLFAIVASAVAVFGAQAAWALPSVSSGDLKLHLDAGAGVSESGGTVTQWADQSGNPNHFEQTNAAMQPVLVPAALNGLPAIRFTSDRLDAVAGHNLNNAAALPFTVFAVTTNTNDPFALFDSAPGQANVFRYSAFNDANPNNPRFAVELWDASPLVSFDLNPAGSVISTMGFLDNTPNRNLSNRTFDNASGTTAAAGVSLNAAQITFLNPDIGTINGGGGLFFNGDVAELIIFDGQLSVPDRFAVENFLRNKYALAPVGFGTTQQLPNPSITAHSPPFNNGFLPELALDGNPLTDFASLGQGTDTFMDFDFGAGTLITEVHYSDRMSSAVPNGQGGGGPLDNVTMFDLIFSTDDIFGNTDDVVVPVDSPGFANTDIIPIMDGDGLLARFVRFDVTGIDGRSLNVGAGEFVFFTTVTTYIPEPATGTLAVLGLAALGLRWRRRGLPAKTARGN